MTKNSDQPDMKRREFFGKTVLAAGAATVAPGVLLAVAGSGEQQGASSDTAGVC